MVKITKKASIWGNIGAIILILLFALIILLILSPGFREIFLGFSSIFDKYDRSEISNSTYFALTPESVGIDISGEKRCQAVPATSTTNYLCAIVDDKNSGNIVFPEVRIFVNIRNGGTKLRSLYGKPIIGMDCESISKCASRVFLQGDKKCSIAPDQTTACDSGTYTFKKDGIYKIYPGYMCEVTSSDGCYEPGASKPVESYNGQNYILVEVKTSRGQ